MNPRHIEVRYSKALCIYRYQGHVGAALVLGGVDKTGASLYCIFPHGSSDELPFVTMGSGSLAAMAVFESRWRPGMEVRIFNPFIHSGFLFLKHSHILIKARGGETTC